MFLTHPPTLCTILYAEVTTICLPWFHLGRWPGTRRIIPVDDVDIYRNIHGLWIAWWITAGQLAKMWYCNTQWSTKNDLASWLATSGYRDDQTASHCACLAEIKQLSECPGASQYSCFPIWSQKNENMLDRLAYNSVPSASIRQDMLACSSTW